MKKMVTPLQVTPESLSTASPKEVAAYKGLLPLIFEDLVKNPSLVEADFLSSYTETRHSKISQYN